MNRLMVRNTHQPAAAMWVRTVYASLTTRNLMATTPGNTPIEFLLFKIFGHFLRDFNSLQNAKQALDVVEKPWLSVAAAVLDHSAPKSGRAGSLTEEWTLFRTLNFRTKSLPRDKLTI